MHDAIREYNTINVFQSAPGLEAGRCPGMRGDRPHQHPVSIRARP